MGLFFLCATTILLWPAAATAAVTPIVASTTNYGSLVNAGLSRDSCVSSLWADNVLWTCRDTMSFANGNPVLPVIANTASFSGKPSPPNNPQPLVLSSPQGFGKLFYKLEADECGEFGICPDGTRYVGWPDSGPVVTFRGPGGAVNAYAFMAKAHLSGLGAINTPAHSLYRLSTTSSGPIPTTNMEGPSFWSSSQVGYGTAASVVRNGYAYLYGTTPDKKLAVARVAQTGFLGDLENRSLYQFYVNGGWTNVIPAANNPGISLPNTSSAQGTVFWSPKWQAYVWIGGSGFPTADFIVRTAPNPEGPWSAGVKFFTGAGGVGALSAYSAVAHPSLTDGTGNYIFLSWTREIKNPTGSGTVYDQPLVRVDWR
ncbi:hypothetical protein C8R47DRAFT_1289970 [Mycena vitilis]|nr:hypothetical protein C8R47DRAFT_1289970 [Mycena vitilis]